MLCHNEFLTGLAIWERRDGLWHCIHCSDSINFISKLEPPAAKHELLKRGFDWEWLPDNFEPGAIASRESWPQANSSPAGGVGRLETNMREPNLCSP